VKFGHQFYFFTFENLQYVNYGSYIANSTTGFTSFSYDSFVQGTAISGSKRFSYAGTFGYSIIHSPPTADPYRGPTTANFAVFPQTIFPTSTVNAVGAFLSGPVVSLSYRPFFSALNTNNLPERGIIQYDYPVNSPRSQFNVVCTAWDNTTSTFDDERCITTATSLLIIFCNCTPSQFYALKSYPHTTVAGVKFTLSGSDRFLIYIAASVWFGLGLIYLVYVIVNSRKEQKISEADRNYLLNAFNASGVDYDNEVDTDDELTVSEDRESGQEAKFDDISETPSERERRRAAGKLGRIHQLDATTGRPTESGKDWQEVFPSTQYKREQRQSTSLRPKPKDEMKKDVSEHSVPEDPRLKARVTGMSTSSPRIDQKP